MALTDTQLATLRTDLATRRQTDTNLDAAALRGDDAYVAAYYNALASPDFFVRQTACPIFDVLDGIVWANFTPADAPPDSTQTPQVQNAWMARSLQCQGKQFNLQLILANRISIDASRQNVYAGLQDALSNVPAGVGGALVSAGWVAVRTALARKARLVEKMFADTSGGNTGASAQLAAKLVFEGLVSATEAGAIR